MSDQHAEMVFDHSPYIPFNSNIGIYTAASWHYHNAVPWEFNGWREEILSWRTSVGIGAILNPTPTVLLRGPDAIRFLSDTCVNSFEKFAIGSSKHAIMCNEQGLVMAHGVILRLAEDEVLTMWISPWLDYLLDRDADKYDVEAVDQSMDSFLFQIAGPRSLETLESATEENLHDLRFARHRRSRIGETDVRVLRIGMAGGLAYEVHGPAEAALSVYNRILEAGGEFGIRQIGMKAYMLNHTESGFPQWGYHFPAPWPEDAGFLDYLDRLGILALSEPISPRGSAGRDLNKRYCNPIELGWDRTVRFDHDFIGREALESYAANPKRKPVTLEWNIDDILDVVRSQSDTDNEPYLHFDDPSQYSFWPAPGLNGTVEDHSPGQWADDVFDENGNIVGMSTGRTFSAFFRRTISLTILDVEHAEEGNELTVLWGEPGTRQKHIRVKVARYPYFNENRNETVDVSAIPVHPKAAASIDTDRDLEAATS